MSPKKRIMSWSISRRKTTTFAYTQVTPNLVLIADFTFDHVHFTLGHTRFPRSVLSILDSGHPGSVAVAEAKMKQVLSLSFDHAEADGSNDFQARCAHVRALNFISDDRMNALVRSLGRWFTLVRRYSSVSKMIAFKPTNLSTHAATLLDLFDEGFGDFLDDDSLPEMERSLMFLSVLVSASYGNDHSFLPPFNGEVIFRHLSTDLCRSIVKTLDVKPIITGDYGWVSAFRLCFPALAIAPTAWFDDSWKRQDFGIDDGAYLLASRLFCALAEIDPSDEVNGVVPKIDMSISMNGSIHHSASGWAFYDHGIETTEQMLEDVKTMDLSRADSVIHAMSTIMSGGSTSRHLKRLPTSSLRTAKRLIFEQLLGRSISSAGEFTPAPWQDPVEYCLSLLTANDRPAYSGLVLESLRPRGDVNETDYSLVTGMVASVLRTGVRDGRLGEVLHYWSDNGEKLRDMIPVYRASLSYLNEAHEAEQDYLPFIWWLRLNHPDQVKA